MVDPMVDPKALDIGSFDKIKFANEMIHFNMILKNLPIPILANVQEAPVFIQIIEEILLEAKKNPEKCFFCPNLHNHIESVGVFSDYSGE